MKNHTKQDFKSVRKRIAELKLMYRRLKHTQEDDGTWSWWIMAAIDELERFLHEEKKKMIARHGDQKESVIYQIISDWGIQEQAE